MASDFGTRLKLRRQQMRLTQAQLARKLGVHPATVMAWEKGEHFPARHLGALQDVLGISLNGVPEDVYTDPYERKIWDDDTLPAAKRRELIATLRQARRDSDAGEDGPGTRAGPV